MVVTVLLPGALRELAGGRRELPIEVGAGAGEAVTVGAVLDRLAAELPGVERRIRDEQGCLRRHVNVFVGAVNVRDAALLATPVPPDTELMVIPAVSGG